MLRKCIFIAALLLSGCTAPTVAVVQPDAPVAIPIIDPLTLNPVQWQVLSVAQLQKLIDSKKTFFLVALDQKNYNNLAGNLIDLQRYISEQKAVLTMLEQILKDRSKSTGAVH